MKAPTPLNLSLLAFFIGTVIATDKTSHNPVTSDLGLNFKRGLLTCQETYGGGSIPCGGADSTFCYDPTLGETCCLQDNGYCDAGDFCAPVAGYCCHDGEDPLTCLTRLKLEFPAASIPDTLAANSSAAASSSSSISRESSAPSSTSIDYTFSNATATSTTMATAKATVLSTRTVTVSQVTVNPVPVPVPAMGILGKIAGGVVTTVANGMFPDRTARIGSFGSGVNYTAAASASVSASASVTSSNVGAGQSGLPKISTPLQVTSGAAERGKVEGVLVLMAMAVGGLWL